MVLEHSCARAHSCLHCSSCDPYAPFVSKTPPAAHVLQPARRLGGDVRIVVTLACYHSL